MVGFGEIWLYIISIFSMKVCIWFNKERLCECCENVCRDTFEVKAFALKHHIFLFFSAQTERMTFDLNCKSWNKFERMNKNKLLFFLAGFSVPPPSCSKNTPRPGVQLILLGSGPQVPGWPGVGAGACITVRLNVESAFLRSPNLRLGLALTWSARRPRRGPSRLASPSISAGFFPAETKRLSLLHDTS